ncbi:hypothetical protein FOMPIDRAFT_1024506 [Fomitopsis schrenkii]|uniref:Hyaluronan/mRNA-binding protein domain-containing protein n=1 Tax=Fomitopsis schrenkii TaxID=2126942 RepID=S8FAY9_FOMSC|nr:hypothetical protein FOMPIDRAFT_1024506 [Fomitopsis schrenkii]
MTRTERAAHPHALIKDRSISKNGMDTRLPKGGAGGHNWGDLSREQYLEDAAAYDEQEDFVQQGGQPPVENVERPTTGRRTSEFSEEQLKAALELRKKAARGNEVDLGSIARSSAAVSRSPPKRDVPITTGASASIRP